MPLLVKWPGVTKAGSTSSVMVSSQDVFPTVLEACGVKHSEPIDGRSMSSALKGSTEPVHADLFWHYPHYANQGGEPGGVVREGNWKLIEFYENGRRELFDMQQGEGRNFAEEKPDVVERLAAKLDAWRKEVGAQSMTPNPKFVPNPQAEDGSITLAASNAKPVKRL